MGSDIYSLSQHRDPNWLRSTGALCMLPQSLWAHKSISPAVSRRPCFLGVFHPDWLLQSFCLTLSLEGRDLREMSRFDQLFRGLSLFIHCSVAVLHLCSCLLQEEASLMMAEWDTDPRVEQNVIRSHFIAAFLRRRAAFGLSQVLGQAGYVREGFYLMEGTSDSIRYWLVTPRNPAMWQYCTSASCV